MADGGISKGKELLKEVVGNYKFSEKDLAWISRKIVNIDKLYLSLDITKAERTTLQRNNLHDHDNMKTDMMLLWKRKKGREATLRTLVTTLVDDDLADDSSVELAEEIIEHFKSKCNDVLKSLQPPSATDVQSLSSDHQHHSAPSIDKRTFEAFDQAKKKGKRRCNQFKVVTVGAEGAGKTSTIRTLLDLPFRDNEQSTQGAEMNKCTVDQFLTTSKWRQITVSVQRTSVLKLHKGEMKASMKLFFSIAPKYPSVAEANIPEKVIDEVRSTLASKDEVRHNETRIVVFDLGGQEVYYEIHYLFLTKEDIVLLLFDASRDLHEPVVSRHRLGKFKEKVEARGMQSNIEIIETHLQSIHFHCGQEAPKGAISPRVPTVIMIGAHAEGLSKEAEQHIVDAIHKHFYNKIFLEYLPEKKEDAFHFIANSDPNPEVVNHLKKTVLKAADHLVDKEYPISYLKFEEEVLRRAELQVKRFQWSEVVEYASGAGLEGDKAVDALLKYYMYKGILLYYPEVESLKGDVFISPQEVSDMVSSVITPHNYNPHKTPLRKALGRYDKFALLEESLIKYMLSESNRSEDENRILGLLQVFNLAAEVPTATQFPGETYVPEGGKVFFVPSLLVYDIQKVYQPAQDDIVVLYHFPSEYLPEHVFNQVLVKTIRWCYGEEGHIIKSVGRGVGEFTLGDGSWQEFRLYLCPSTYSINCCIIIHPEVPPDDMLPLLLQQRKALLQHLETSIATVYNLCMPSAQKPVVYLKCPLDHKSDCPPHIMLHGPKICHSSKAQRSKNLKSYYVELYEPVHVQRHTGSSTQPAQSSADFKPANELQIANMKLMHKIVIPKVSPYWEKLHAYLEYDIITKREIETKYKGDPQQCCTALLEDWIMSDRGVGPKTYTKLLEVLDEMTEIGSITEQIKNCSVQEKVIERCGYRFTSVVTGQCSTTELLSLEPQLHLVLKVVVPKVAAYWVTVAHNLQYDVSRVKIIEQKCRGDPEKCAYELFTYWLQSSEGIGPRIWNTLLHVLNQIPQIKELAVSIEEEVVKLLTKC